MFVSLVDAGLKWTSETESDLKEVKIPPCREKAPVTSATWNSRATAARLLCSIMHELTRARFVLAGVKLATIRGD